MKEAVAMRRKSRLIAILALLITLLTSGTAGAGTPAKTAFRGPLPVASGFAGPNGLAVDRRGDLYVSERLSSDVAVLSVIRARVRDADDTEADDAEGDVSAAPAGSKREIYRVTAVAPFTEPAIGSTTFDAAGNVYVVSGQHAVSDLLFVRRAIVRIDRRSHAAAEIFVAEGSDPALGQPASAGIAVDRHGTVYFGQFNTLYRLSTGAPRTAIATFGSTARISSYPLVETDGSIVVIVSDGPLSAIYSVRRNGDIVRLAHIRPTEPGVTGFLGIGADAAGNVYVIQRVPHGFQRFTCAVSTTMLVFRLDGKAVRTATIEFAPTEVGTITQAGHLGLVGAGSQFFRVTSRGDVIFGVYPFFPFCPPAPLPPFPFSNQSTARRVLAFAAQPDGTLSPHVLIDVPAAPVVMPGTGQVPGAFEAFSFAVRERELFVADGAAGTIVRFQRR